MSIESVIKQAEVIRTECGSYCAVQIDMHQHCSEIANTYISVSILEGYDDEGAVFKRWHAVPIDQSGSVAAEMRVWMNNRLKRAA